MTFYSHMESFEQPPPNDDTFGLFWRSFPALEEVPKNTLFLTFSEIEKPCQQGKLVIFALKDHFCTKIAAIEGSSPFYQ